MRGKKARDNDFGAEKTGKGLFCGAKQRVVWLSRAGLDGFRCNIDRFRRDIDRLENYIDRFRKYIAHLLNSNDRRKSILRSKTVLEGQAEIYFE